MKRAAQSLIAALLLASGAMVLLSLFPERPVEEEGGLPHGTIASVRAAGPWAHAAVALGAGCILAAAAGAIAGWSRAPVFVRWFGHAAFVAGLAGAAMAFDAALHTAARIGRAVTPADFADSTDAALASMVVGTVAEAVALGCAGVLLLRAPQPPSHR